MNVTSPKNPIFLALDGLDFDQTLAIAKLVKQNIGGIKIGLECWYKFSKSQILNLIEQIGLPVFLDLKLHDIPQTVENAIKHILDIKPFFTSIHASGGSEMIRKACNVAAEVSPNTKVLAITMLTSISAIDLTQMGITLPSEDLVLNLANIALKAKVGGIVCSPHEIKTLRSKIGNNFIIVTPGIRFNYYTDNDDQRRTMIPKDAIDLGANFLIIGRPITKSQDPLKTSEEIYNSIYKES